MPGLRQHDDGDVATGGLWAVSGLLIVLGPVHTAQESLADETIPPPIARPSRTTFRHRRSMTYTYAILPVSRAAFEEIAAKLRAAGYDHVFHEDEGGTIIDLHGVAIQAEEGGADGAWIA